MFIYDGDDKLTSFNYKYKLDIPVETFDILITAKRMSTELVQLQHSSA